MQAAPTTDRSLPASMPAEITDARTGGTVLVSDGEPVGTIGRVEEGVAYSSSRPTGPTFPSRPSGGARRKRARRTIHTRPTPTPLVRSEGDAETDQKAAEAAQASGAEQDPEDSIERERAARNSTNPNAHREEEPFGSYELPSSYALVSGS